MKNILIAITSSISAYKIYELIRMYKKSGFNVKVILSPNALNFVSPLTLEALSQNKVYFEQFASRDDIEHITLATWADVFVIAPISANTISKIAQGICDNLLTSVFCAYFGYKKPVLLAPAMNEGMWNNPIIQQNLDTLKNLDCTIIYPETGFLACGKDGVGRLAKIETIYHKTLRLLYQNKENNSKKIVVTIGATKEKIDNVRYITNLSSGKMGIAIANWAYYSGYDVTAITTVEIDMPYKTIKVDSALEMLEKLREIQNDNKEERGFDYLIMAAAVADFRSENINETKISKEHIKDEFILKLIKNPDIVSTVAKEKKEYQKIIGFCLADDDIINCAKKKLKNKNLDYIVANEIKTALNTDKNKVTIIDKSDNIIDIDLDTKENIAKKILEVVCD